MCASHIVWSLCEECAILNVEDAAAAAAADMCRSACVSRIDRGVL
jgi:hypothetical protein